MTCPTRPDPRRTPPSRSAGGHAISRWALLLLLGARPLRGRWVRGLAAGKTPPAEPPATERFALTPTGADPSQPGERTSFSFHLVRGHVGQRQGDAVQLRHPHDDLPGLCQRRGRHGRGPTRPQTVRSETDRRRRLDPPPAGHGHARPVARGRHPLRRRRAQLGARPGDHAAGIVAAVRGSTTTPTGQVVAVESRFGVPLFVRVAGPTNPKLSVVDLQLHYHRVAALVGGRHARRDVARGQHRQRAARRRTSRWT